jgi:hypothetical protein
VDAVSSHKQLMRESEEIVNRLVEHVRDCDRLFDTTHSRIRAARQLLYREADRRQPSTLSMSSRKLG